MYADVTLREKKSPVIWAKALIWLGFWRRVRDSNPRFLLGTRHFECRTFDLSDNSPYTSSVILAPEECKKNTQERYEIVKSEPAQSPARRTFSADETAGASKNFECCTFDHSDNSPCLFSSGFLSRNLLKNSLERKQERRQKIFDFEIFCVEEYQGESGGRNSKLLPKFRVSPVMTTSIPLHDRALHIYIVYPAGRENAIHLFTAFF